MIHARIVDSIPEENRGPITHALMGTTPTPVVPARMQGARMPPVGKRVRELPRGDLRKTMQQLAGIVPGMGKK